MATLPDVRVLNVCLECKGRKDPQLDAWDRLLNRIERTMRNLEQTEIPYRKRMVSRLSSDTREEDKKAIESRLLKFAPRSSIIADESREQEITKVFRKMTVFNPIPSKFGGWSGGKAKNIPLERIIEDPIFKPSHQSFFVQLADCVAFALLKRDTPPSALVSKYGINAFFDECLTGVCHKPASLKDSLGIVRR